MCQYSTKYVPEFVEAAMSIDSLGGVSAPYLSDFGVHIVKYISDVEAGPVTLSDADRESRRAELLADKQQELYTNVMTGWRNEATVEYTDVLLTVEQVEALEATAADEELAAAEAEATAEPETTVEPEATEEAAETTQP